MRFWPFFFIGLLGSAVPIQIALHNWMAAIYAAIGLALAVTLASLSKERVA